MKTRRFTIYDLRFTRAGRERGIALIITLILLSVTLVMAIAFLAISRRQSTSVSTYADSATAKYAADAALAKAENRIVTQILMTTNPYVFSLMVSTNYINPTGFFPGVASPTNVNYDYYAPGQTEVGHVNNGADLAQNIANLFYDPRPPVFYASNDFRFYLDLNRNGQFDTNGYVPEVNNANLGYGVNGSGSGAQLYSLQVGDPEWIGILEHPDQPHGPNNRFIARYCFIAVPANSMDLNYSHNQAWNASPSGNNLSANNDGYFRNQNVGTWELNLAAFLADLNTNIWDPQNAGNQYQYRRPGFANAGYAFNDAYSLLTSRYANLYPSQPSVQNLFGANGVNAFDQDGIDAYTLGRQTTFDTNYSPVYGIQGIPSYFWVGAANTNNFFTPDDLFNTTKTVGFGTRLQNAGVNTSDANGRPGTTVPTYDRYTYYRMLAQLGTSTAPAQGKINLNYKNVYIGYDTNNPDRGTYGPVVTNLAKSITFIPNGETNFLQWSPQDFFTAAANQLLQAYTTEWFESSPSNFLQTYYGLTTNYNVMTGFGLTNYPYFGLTNQIPSFGITNIPVYVNGAFAYTPAVNRLLQLAANIYDSTTNSMTFNDSNYPSVFRPIFWKTNELNPVTKLFVNNVYVRGYHCVVEGPVGSEVPTSFPPARGFGPTIFCTPCEVTDPYLQFGYSITNVWGVPWIVGAKKSFPNFNGFELDNTFFIERKLQVTRNNVTPGEARTYATNQMYMIGISNAYAMDDWNSYSTAYNNQIMVWGENILAVGLTNNANFSYANVNTNAVLPAIATWPAGVFVMPFGTNVTVMQNLSPLETPPVPPSTNNLYMYFAGPGTVQYQGYTFPSPCFIPNSLNPSNYLNAGTPPLPQTGLVASNHLQAFMVDRDPSQIPHIIDYVQLGSMNSSLDVNGAIADVDENGLWSTNYYGNSGNTPDGVVQQINTGLTGGSVPTEDQDNGGQGPGGAWNQGTIPGLSQAQSQSPQAQQAFFSAFFSSGDTASYPGGTVTNWDYSMQAPFTPMREVVQRYVYQANDPLVHYLTSDLNDFVDDTSNRVNITAVQSNILTKVGVLSDRYMPWGNTIPSAPSFTPSQNQMANFYGTPVDNNSYNLGYKDPLVWTSDNWDFPTNKYPTVGWIGRVHRGTPWQSVYLKSADIWAETQAVSNGPTLNTGQATWQAWTGNLNADDAYNEDPVQDRLLFDLFTATPDDDATRGQVSVNIGADDPNNPLAGLASWSALLSSTLVFSNDVPDFVLPRQGNVGFESPSAIATLDEVWPGYSIWTNQPLGIFNPYTTTFPNVTNYPLGAIVEGINSTRTNFVGTEQLKGVFEHVGDILATPQLSVASPYIWLNGVGDSSRYQLKYGISDEMYEWLPQQMMGLMTVSGTSQSPPRYVIYCYGQTLKPAANGYVSTPGQFFGLYTNYQVVAESAARVVLRVENSPTPANPGAMPHVVVEQYNPLPPD